MTYRQLAQDIQTLSEEQKDQDVTIAISNQPSMCDDLEYRPVKNFSFQLDSNDVLDPNHPVINI